MQALWNLERQIATCDRLETPVSSGLSVVATAAFVVEHGAHLAGAAWLVPALMAFGTCKLGFAWLRTRLERARLDSHAEASFPTAIARGVLRAPAPLPVAMPPAIVPADLATGPRFLG